MFWIVIVCGLPALLRTEQPQGKRAIPSTVNGTEIKGFAIDGPEGGWIENGSDASSNAKMTMTIAKKNTVAKNTYKWFPRSHRSKCTYIYHKVIL